MPSTQPSRGYMPPAQSHDWATPKELFDQLWREFGPFDLDPCGQREHHYSAWMIDAHGGRFMDGSTEAMDGLVQPWFGRVYMNPPYGDALRKLWVPRAVREVRCGNAEMVVALLPARTDTRWWQQYVLRRARWYPYMDPGDMQCDEVRFLPGRLKFGDSKVGAPFPSAIVVWRRTELVAPPQPAAQAAFEEMP